MAFNNKRVKAFSNYAMKVYYHMTLTEYLKIKCFKQILNMTYKKEILKIIKWI